MATSKKVKHLATETVLFDGELGLLERLVSLVQQMSALVLLQTMLVVVMAVVIFISLGSFILIVLSGLNLAWFSLDTSIVEDLVTACLGGVLSLAAVVITQFVVFMKRGKK